MASTNRQKKNGLLHKKEKPGLPWGGKITPAPQPTQSYTTKAVKFDKDRQEALFRKQPTMQALSKTSDLKTKQQQSNDVVPVGDIPKMYKTANVKIKELPNKKQTKYAAPSVSNSMSNMRMKFTLTQSVGDLRTATQNLKPYDNFKGDMPEEDHSALNSESGGDSMLLAPFVGTHIINDRKNDTTMKMTNQQSGEAVLDQFKSKTIEICEQEEKMIIPDKKKASYLSPWKNEYDQNNVYRIEKSLSFTSSAQKHHQEIYRWRDNDIKGNRKTNYVKEVASRNSDIMTIVNQTRLEKYQNYTDGHRCLNFRKRILRFKVHVNNACLFLTVNRYFESFIILVIGLNCITLAQSDSTKQETSLDATIELIFQVIYTIEMILRIGSLGFVYNKGSYLRSAWNQLDFVCVMTGFIGIVGGSDNAQINGIRAFRVLRPLRTINQIEGLRTVVQSVMGAVSLLQDVLLILVFFMLIFAIGGLNLFMGMLMQRCVDEETGNALFDDDDNEVICGYAECPTGYYCGKMTLNPNYDTTNFDNIFSALLSVFQCITLEGWSDMMVMYQKAYTPAVFFFFVALVFIGAFFFLNLTLAVINSSYSTAQARIKAHKIQLKQEQSQLLMKPKNDDEAYLQSQNKDTKTKLGVTEFFVAKRAANKLIAFWKNHKQEVLYEEAAKKKQKDADNIQAKAQEKADFLRTIDREQKTRNRKFGSQEKSSMNSSIDQDESSKGLIKNYIGAGLIDGTTRKSDMTIISNAYNIDDITVIGKFDIANSINVIAISEEDVKADEDDVYQEEVMLFLDQVNRQSQQSITVDKEFDTEVRRLGQSPSLVNAFNDIRISGANMIKGDSKARLLNAPSRKNLSTIMASQAKETIDQPYDDDEIQQVESDKHQWVLEELDFDKIIGLKGDQRRGSINVPPQQNVFKEADDAYNNQMYKSSQTIVQHAYDLDFTEEEISMRDQQFDEKEKQNFSRTLNNAPDKGEEDLDFVSSIISSDDSFAQKLKDFSIKPIETTLKQDDKQRVEKSKTMKKQLHRMLSADFSKTNLAENENKDLVRSNSFLENIPSFKKQVNLMTSLQLHTGNANDIQQLDQQRLESREESGGHQYSMLTVQTQQSVQSNGRKERLKKKEQIEIYNNIDRQYFLDEQPSNPLEFIDKNVLKVVINPGVPYISTSVNEIFENRIAKQEAKAIKTKNPFITISNEGKLADNSKNRYDDKDEDFMISSMFEPYQLKQISKIKQVQEVDFGEVEEDALILAHQPYETVMQTGFKDYLNHLKTHLNLRRSDIIVSSTLSITLAPFDDDFIPTSFRYITEKEIKSYVNRRQQYRAMGVTQCKLPKSKIDTEGSADEILDESDSDEEEFRDKPVTQFAEFQFDEEDDFVKLGTMKRSAGIQETKISLPLTLLTEPLNPNKASRLRDKDRKLYNLQKSKHEVTMKGISKKLIHPSKQTFTLKDAQILVSGQYFLEEEQDDVLVVPIQVQNQQILKRATINTANQQQKELKLENFDEEITILNQSEEDNKNKGKDPREKSDNIPAEIKSAFNLPKDMSNLAIDFTEVRIVDAQFKKRQPTWSGQDVLEMNLNMNKSNWVIKQMNSLRVWPKGFHQFFKKGRSILKGFVRTSLFENAMSFCVLINTIGMAMDSYDIDQQKLNDLELMNEIFTWIFIVELVLKLLARGPKKYVAEPMNLLDGGVVTISIIEMIIASQGGEEGGGGLQAFRTVRVFRTFRVLRVTRILRSLKSMAMIIGVIQIAFMDFIWITLLMFVFIFIYTLLGRQIFQGRYDFGEDEELPRENYESFTIAFITVFQVLTMENWQSVLFASMRAARGSIIYKAVTALYYISWIFIGNFILLNLFLAILIDSFSEADADLENDDEEARMSERELLLKQQKLLKLEKQKRMKKIGTNQEQIDLVKSTKTSKIEIKKKKQKASFTGNKRINEEFIEEVEDLDHKTVRLLLIKEGILKANKGEIDEKNIGTEIEADNSVYLFNRDSRFRKNIYFIQKHHYFDRFIMLLIALSSTKLALESYFVYEPVDSQIVLIGENMDMAFNFLFIAECILKVIALGFAMDDGSYLRDSWNGLDFFIVMSSVIDMLLASADIPALKVLRLLRMIRPLRVISHSQQLKMIIAALFESVGSIINVSFVVMIIWLMFAIYGMNTYMGMFFYCTKDRFTNNNEWLCEDHGGEWKRFDSNFDDIGQAMMTLFIVSSLEGWPDIMYQAIDITMKDNGPKQESSPAQMIFFIVFILIGSFFFLNFFIGVLFLKYEQAQRKEEEGFSKQQLYWLELQRLIVEKETPHELRYKPRHQNRLRLYNVIISDAFDVSIMVCIVLNMFQMAIDHEGASQGTQMFLKVSNYFFTAVFFIEAVIKMYVYRLAYFKTAWNKFDFFVVISSLIDLAIELSLPTPEGGNVEGGSEILSVGPQLARVLRVLRVSRILRLADKYEGLQALLKTIQLSVSSLINVFILLMLIFFIMAVLGNSLFYQVTEGIVIDEWKNFTNFHMSFSLLFSISTGEDWNRIMYDCMRLAPDCIEGKTCGSNIAPVFFLSFILIVTHIMLNLFVLVIIQQFQKYYLEPDNPRVRFEEDFDDFKEAWRQFARYQCTKLKVKLVNNFLRKLPYRMQNRMQLKENASNLEVNRTILKMGITVDDGYIYFNEMLYRVMRAQFGKVRFNKVMALNELVTQYKIMELTIKQKEFKGMKKDKKEQAFFSKLQSTPANPFLTRMFYKASFKAWHKYVINFQRKQEWEKAVDEERAAYKRIGRFYKEPHYHQPKVAMADVEIEKEIEIHMSCSDDDISYADEIKSKTLSDLSNLAGEKLLQSPDIFRHKAKQRTIRRDMRFSMIMTKQDWKSQKQSMMTSVKSKDESHFTGLNKFKRHQSVIHRSPLMDMNSRESEQVNIMKRFNRLEGKRNSAESIKINEVLSSSSESYQGRYAQKKKKPKQSNPKAGLNGQFERQSDQ